MTRLLRTIGATLLALCLAGPLWAQTVLTSTTLSAAMTNVTRTVNLTSATGIAARDYIYVDGEVMTVQAITGTVALVVRGREGTQAVAHVNTAVVWALAGSTTTGAGRLYHNEVKGGCTRTSEVYLPHIVAPSGNIADCLNGEWVQFRQWGNRHTEAGRSDGGTTYTVAGAITVQPGISFIGSGGVLAMTLIDPTTEQNGMVMWILASTAQAHTVTYTAGFGGGTVARDVATFGGAINDGMAIVAFNGVWWVISTRNVTLG